MGRPPKYAKAMCAKVIDYGKLGYSKAEIAMELDVSRETIYEWGRTHGDFSDALKKSEDYASAYYNRTFREMAMGEVKNGQAVPLIFAAKNQLPDEFRDKREHVVDAELGIFEIDFRGYKGDEITKEE